MTETSGADTVDPAATDRRGLKVLGFEECLQRLHDAPVGRVGFLRDGEIAILPVNHVVDGMDIAFRTSWGSKLQTAADAGRVAFEVDGHDPPLVHRLERPRPRHRHARLRGGGPQRLDALAAKPWIPLDVNTFWVRIRPEEITGREISSPGTTDGPAAGAPSRAPPGRSLRSGLRHGASAARVSCGQDDLQRAGLTGAREHVVRLHDSSSGNRWVTNRLTSTWRLVTSLSSVGVE